MALYRIAQEALSNAARHAQAEIAWITLTFQSDRVILEIRDDGKGFSVPTDPTAYARQGHYGLLGMQERAELIDARLQITSEPGEGTSVTVLVLDPPPSQG
jgi:signal transduction histidine kinase